ncbi:hypothetical protein Psi02_46010 [Planotetraspora silvatica]|uniref:Uncharacterized protein n=1 Tax=Planotetraspora silvatica TaxID=234614 RepID=A0A8J3UQX4_9ACTN|nr:hypothetical protein [Planotetraspora silvatica]GII48177.1 hypothetical protein Psi02_46010 [Planotetraspora silvatica]
MTSPHFLMELHVPACAVSNGSHAGHIPQLGAITRTGPAIMNGRVRPAVRPDVGVETHLDSADDQRVG